MLYLHEVFVNWWDDEEKSYNVPEVFEWRLEDKMTLLDQVPLLVVESKLFDYIANDLRPIPEAILMAVDGNAYEKENKKKKRVNWTFVMTDKERILAVNTMETQFPFRKSKMIPRTEGIIYEMVVDCPFMDVEFPDVVITDNFSDYAGMTRREKSLKALLELSLDKVGERGNISELKYWIKEFDNSIEFNGDEEFSELYGIFMLTIKKGWSKEHEKLCNEMVKGSKNKVFKEILEKENKHLKRVKK